MKMKCKKCKIPMTLLSTQIDNDGKKIEKVRCSGCGCSSTEIPSGTDKKAIKE